MPEATPVAATVSRGGRMRIPQPVLKALGLSDGDQLVFFVRPGHAAALVTPAAEAFREPKW